ncbi:D-alanyl-D-alanine carboxypeptidase family protein [Parachitinimonas caeni]|uniref:serine-type D-Ala-D-Ala carboxypeptidase n=1 Tax=Parachitinimonas caeni TaxID=3031301 RepID=A0ABT7DRV9_9NEIS|nr:D-alanyl-D-alanine carboxypeptidase family protein [Parachitinimonas caeni]MDK2122803.1 D-alanyl-D-alanine carboxypeptidase [Parachitinimonas caeni]
MKRLLFAGLAGLLLNATVFANAMNVPPVPEIAARSYFLVDYQSGKVIAARGAADKVEPASLTKLMTAYLTFKAVKRGSIKLDQQFTVSQKGWKTEGSRMFLDPKKPAKVEELIRGMIVQSGNDACVTLAEAIAGDEAVFAQMMNTEAARLGMKNTHFMNATGLPHPQHYSTAEDLAILSAAIIRDFPEFYPIYSLKEYRYNNISQPNRNLLLFRDPSVDGMKTGHTDNAGFCLVASTHRDGRRLISVLLGAANENVRAVESLKLLNYGLQFYDTPKLYSAKQVVSSLPVWKGAVPQVQLGFQADQFMTLPRGQSSKIKADLVTQQPLVAPIRAGQTLGKLKLTLEGQPVGELPVVALAEVQQAGILGRAWDTMRLWFH